MPPNMLKAKVGGGSGGPDLAAIRRAEAAMEEIKGQFADWAADDVKKLMEARARYVAAPDAASQAGLLRAAHDMKGQAATFNYPLIARVAGSLSKLIGELPGGKPLPMALVDAHVTAVHVIYRDKMTGADNKTALVLIGELDRQVADVLKV